MWLRINNQRINTESVASFGIDTSGNTYVNWLGGGCNMYEGSEVADALDASLPIYLPEKKRAEVVSLSERAKQFVTERNARRAQYDEELKEIA